MKKFLFPIVAILIFFSCKTEKNKAQEKEKEPISILDKIALAHGYDKWKNVSELDFTFNVDRDTSHMERTWRWKVSTGEVVNFSQKDTIRYLRTAVDSISLRADAGFTNDRYWLLAPFNLVWDRDNFSYSHEAEASAPISKEPMQKLTIVYGNEGGYTPGDAYDFYYADDYLIREWVFRKSNQPEASLTTTWEEYQNVGGLKLATSHKVEDNSWRLYFSDIEVH
ncbi:MAG: hypothetical protein WBM43_03195 [Flavobacteriaceae bacterium]